MKNGSHIISECSVSLAEIARRVGVQRSAVSKWVRRGIPANRVVAVSRATGIPARVLKPEIFGEMENET